MAVLSLITGAFFWKDRLHQDTLMDGQTYGGLLCESFCVMSELEVAEFSLIQTFFRGYDDILDNITPGFTSCFITTNCKADLLCSLCAAPQSL